MIKHLQTHFTSLRQTHITKHIHHRHFQLLPPPPQPPPLTTVPGHLPLPYKSNPFFYYFNCVGFLNKETNARSIPMSCCSCAYGRFLLDHFLHFTLLNLLLLLPHFFQLRVNHFTNSYTV
ncbi:hypothetical protein QVD17_16944 [Tagetes erecta]|uniref:Uncharacterized protein n=1 Tax=Tagetes erecta TaxID=13708 RepID=A0AAD8P101_TARER|nr:hypothetical protein QVD17_16944 [Tagetes erecta]